MTEPALDYVLWGVGGHGRVVADLVRALRGRVFAWVTTHPGNDDARHAGRDGTPVIAATQWASWREGALASGHALRVIPAVGKNAARYDLLESLGSLLAPPLIHPSAVVSDDAVIGPGSVVMPLAVISPRARLGRGAIVNTGAIIEHDCLIGDAVHVSPGAVLAGTVTVSARAWIGASAVVIPERRIGEDAVVGAGAVVIHDVPVGATVVGNPAKVLKQRSV